MKKQLFVLYLFFVIPLYSKVHVIGDSHSLFSFSNNQKTEDLWEFFEENEPVHIPYSIHWIGSNTMHRVGRDGLDFLDIRKLGAQEKDVVIFSFGEIDVRCHIGIQRDRVGRSLEEIVETLMEKYFTTLKKNRALFREIDFIVFNILPPTDAAYNIHQPYYGTLEDRVSIAKLCNKVLKKQCHTHGFYMLDVYDHYCLEDGSFNPLLSDSSVHIHPLKNGYVKEKLFETLKKLLPSKNGT